MSEISKEDVKKMKGTILGSEMDYKCVRRMRLEDEGHEYRYIKVDNGLDSENDL
nr:hypothetical protein [Staphylococcus epidermidis]